MANHTTGQISPEKIIINYEALYFLKMVITWQGQKIALAII